MNEYQVESVYFAEDKFVLKAPDGRVLSTVYPDRKPLDYTATVLNSELEVQWMRLTEALLARIAELEAQVKALQAKQASDSCPVCFGTGQVGKQFVPSEAARTPEMARDLVAAVNDEVDLEMAMELAGIPQEWLDEQAALAKQRLACNWCDGTVSPETWLCTTCGISYNDEQQAEQLPFDGSPEKQAPKYTVKKTKRGFYGVFSPNGELFEQKVSEGGAWSLANKLNKGLGLVDALDNSDEMA